MIDRTIGIATSSTQLPNLFNENAAKRQTLPCQAFSGFATSPRRAKIIVLIPVQGSASCCHDDNNEKAFDRDEQPLTPPLRYMGGLPRAPWLDRRSSDRSFPCRPAAECSAPNRAWP